MRTRSWLLCMFFLISAPVAAAQEPEPVAGLPDNIRIDSGTIRTTTDGVILSGDVTIVWRDSRIQADRMTLTERRYIEAEGNILIVWGGNRIFGTRLTYDLEEERGVIANAIGEALDEYIFWAKQVEKVGPNRLHLKSATVTTCTQPIPYWSFSVSSATITIDNYARMWNVRLRAGRAPVIYLPYLVWPVKEDRAAGLLMPEFATTQNRGRSITQELFIPLGRSADLTLLARHYSKAGLGGGGELRFIPNREGKAVINGFYIEDQDGTFAGKGRYRATYAQDQKFLNGFRMLADVNLVSDPNFYSDFERDLNIASSPIVKSRLEFSRNGSWASLNVRELRQEQLSTEKVQQTLPEIEWRGRSRRLGKTPFYLSFESSLASIQQFGPDIDADYLRGDVFPTISVPWSPRPWIDITPRISYRLTHYTQRKDAMDSVTDNSLTRRLGSAGVDIIGPKLFKIYERGPGELTTRYKHTFEPRISYGVGESFDRSKDILLFDEVDGVTAAGNKMTYSLIQRLFAQRPRAVDRPADADADSVILPDGTTPVTDDSAPPEEPEPAARNETVEIASLEIRQSRTFDDDVSLSQGIVSATSTELKESLYSDVTLTGRFNPSPRVSLDLRSRYDVVFDKFADLSLSGSVRQRLASVRFSLSHRNGLGFDSLVPEDPETSGTATVPRKNKDSTQLRLTTGLRLLSGKLRIDVDGFYDGNPVRGGARVPEQRWRVQYSTQCCIFFVERLTRDFTNLDDRRELHFRVDLTGIGKILSHTF